MLGLAIHTCSPQLGLMLQTIESAESTDKPVQKHQVWDLGREVSSHLHVKLIEFIAPYTWQDLGFVAVAKGPGGFTGTRIGVVTARTLAQQLELPLFGVSALAALAAQAIEQDALQSGQDIAVTMPAKREAVYGAIYRQQGEELSAVRAEAVVGEDEWTEILQNWERPLRQVSTAMNAGTAASVTGVMQLAQVQWQQGSKPEWISVMPFYGQHPVHR